MEIISGEEPKNNRKNSFISYNDPNEKYWGMDERQYSMLLHLSQLTGILLPLIMWLFYKGKNKNIDAHGRTIFNWILTLLLATGIGAFLTFTILLAVVGIPILIGFSIMSIVYTIQGASKAANGDFFTYPLAIPFLK